MDTLKTGLQFGHERCCRLRAGERVAPELEDVPYAGVGTVRCLTFKPAGHRNIAAQGCQPIPVRDATHNAPATYNGQNIDMDAAGIARFEWLCLFSTTLDLLEEALDAEPGRKAPWPVSTRN